MRAYRCPRCAAMLDGARSRCPRCGAPVGLALPLGDRARSSRRWAPGWKRCIGSVTRTATGSCRRRRPTLRVLSADADRPGRRRPGRPRPPQRHRACQAPPGLPVARPGAARRRPAADPARGLAFDLLSSRLGPVVTGHADGVITIDLAESDDAHRAMLQAQLDEPYRTVRRSHPPRDRPLLLEVLVDRRRPPGRVPGALRRRARLIPRRPSTGTIARVRQPAGEWTMSAPTRRCIPGRTGPRRSPTTSTSGTRSRPRPRGASASLDRPATRHRSPGSCPWTTSTGETFVPVARDWARVSAPPSTRSTARWVTATCTRSTCPSPVVDRLELVHDLVTAPRPGGAA